LNVMLKVWKKWKAFLKKKLSPLNQVEEQLRKTVGNRDASY